MFAQRVRNLLAEHAQEIALPKTCAGCGLAGEWVCDNCAWQLIVDPQPGCLRCGRQGYRRQQCGRCADLFPSPLRQVRAGFRYEGPMRRAIQRFKYNGEYQRGYDLGQRLAASVVRDRLLPVTRIDAIVPVPLHRRRFRSRGFNQSDILARCVSSELQIPVVYPVQRLRNTTPQVGLRSDQRLENLEDAFGIDVDEHPDLSGARMLIVDDVMTTGATISAVASTLANAGSGDLFGLTLAREH